MDGLRANERIGSLLTGWRYQAMRQAREEGHSWSEIGAALNMSKQAAWESVQALDREQERYVPELFQPGRRRAVPGAAHRFRPGGPRHNRRPRCESAGLQISRRAAAGQGR